MIVASDNLLPSAHSWNKQQVYDADACNGLALTLGAHLTCTDVTKAILRARKRHVTTVVQPTQSETSDDLLVDVVGG